MHKKKLLYVVEAMGGGIFTYLVDLVNELANDFDIYIAYGVRPQTPSDYQKYFDSRVSLIKVDDFVREISPYNDFKALKEVKQIAKEIKPDIIHLHSSKAGVIGRLAFNGKTVPVFYTPHGYSFLMRDTNKLKRLIYWWIEKIFSYKKCTIISCSPGEYYESLKLTKNSTYVNNAINVDVLDKRLSEIKKVEHPFTVFTLGRVCYQKNPKLFNSIAEAMPKIKFLWIGDGELVSELTSPNIEITGWLDRSEALKKSMNSDVFILTSLWEGLPMSLLEAMYMKKTCVVSDVIGNNDVISNGKNGYVCNSVEEYVKAINERKEEYINNAYLDLLKNYVTKVQASRYAKIYLNIKNQRSA